MTVATLLALLEMAERLFALAQRIKEQEVISDQELLDAAAVRDMATLDRTQAWILKLKS